MTSPPAAADHWDAARVARWLGQADAIDRQLAPVTSALFAAAEIAAGERVLDVGCGHGPTTRLAAVRAGRSGAVTGVDVAPAMLDAARGVDPGDDAAPLEWVEADVATGLPALDPFDVVLSRFGVMFFTSPVAAFERLRRAAAPTGRLAIATWAPRDRSDLFQVPMDVTVQVLEEEGADIPTLPVDGGPFSLGTPGVVHDVLGGAGWREVDPVEHTVPLLVGGGVGPAEAARSAMGLGPTRLLTGDLPEAQRDRIAAAIEERFADHRDGDGHVALRATFLITTARAA